MSDPQQISALEASHLAYDVFIFTVGTLSCSPEEQCEAMGDYNTAWELRDDALAGHYLIGSGLFTEQQESAVLAFLAAVHPVPVNDMPAGSGRVPNLAAMQHSAWEPRWPLQIPPPLASQTPPWQDARIMTIRA